MLLEGSTTVHIEIHSKLGEVEICGMEQSEVYKVTHSTRVLIDMNQVHRLRLECDNTSTTNSFAVQYINLARASIMKSIKELVAITAEYNTKELALCGSKENIVQSPKLVQDFLDANFMEELVISTEDVSALLTGGKAGKFV